MTQDVAEVERRGAVGSAQTREGEGGPVPWGEEGEVAVSRKGEAAKEGGPEPWGEEEVAVSHKAGEAGAPMACVEEEPELWEDEGGASVSQKAEDVVALWRAAHPGPLT